jgi:hypothetical protein
VGPEEGAEQVITLAAALLLALLVVVVGIRFSPGRRDAVYGPRLYDSFSAILEPYEGTQPSPSKLSALEVRLQRLFDDALTGVGLDPTGWNVRLVLDDVLGPVAMLEDRTGKTLSVARFEQELREGSLELGGDRRAPPNEGVYRKRE